jgi:hypothetical protein
LVAAIETPAITALSADKAFAALRTAGTPPAASIGSGVRSTTTPASRSPLARLSSQIRARLASGARQLTSTRDLSSERSEKDASAH